MSNKAFEELAKATAQERKAIVLYKKDDPGLALFRLTSANKIVLLTTNHHLGKSINKANSVWWQTWLSDAVGGVGDLFRDYIQALEKATGRPLKWYAKKG